MNENCLKCVEEAKADSYCWHDIEERFGLEGVESFGDPQASYSFDDFRIWKRKTDGAMFYGTDSGCSCPSPFESDRFKTIADLTPITPNSWETFKSEFEAYANQNADSSYNPYRHIEANVVIETLDRVRAMLYQMEAR